MPIDQIVDLSSSPASSPLPPQPTWEAEDEVMRAAKSFAQIFNGQLVNLEDQEGPTNSDSSEHVSQTEEASLSQQEHEENEDDEDDDVPF
jgi:DNA polymerase-3 subunit gamma/tau